MLPLRRFCRCIGSAIEDDMAWRRRFCHCRTFRCTMRDTRPGQQAGASRAAESSRSHLSSWTPYNWRICGTPCGLWTPSSPRGLGLRCCSVTTLGARLSCRAPGYQAASMGTKYAASPCPPRPLPAGHVIVSISCRGVVYRNKLKDAGNLVEIIPVLCCALCVRACKFSTHLSHA